MVGAVSLAPATAVLLLLLNQAMAVSSMLLPVKGSAMAAATWPSPDKDGNSGEGKDCPATMVGAVSLALATAVLLSLLNQASTVSSMLLPVMPSKATSAME